ARWLVGAAVQPGEQVAVRWREPRPQHFDVMQVLLAKRRDGGLGEPRRDADAQSAGDELDERPAAGFIECIEPPGELCRQLCLTEPGQRLDDGSEGDFFHLPPGWR